MTSLLGIDLIIYQEEWSYSWKYERENQYPEFTECWEIIQTLKYELKELADEITELSLVIKKNNRKKCWKTREK